MKELYLRELIKYKKLPFNIYNEKGQILMYTGDLLTPGKLMELKNAMILLYDENFEHKSQKERGFCHGNKTGICINSQTYVLQSAER